MHHHWIAAAAVGVAAAGCGARLGHLLAVLRTQRRPGVASSWFGFTDRAARWEPESYMPAGQATLRRVGPWFAATALLALGAYGLAS
jgi:hypothetical protein